MEQQIQLIGWIGFLVGCGLFLAQSWLSSDLWGVGASLAFLFGCLVFIAPLVLSHRHRQ